MRYSRQTLLPEIGQQGQQRLRQASVLVVGVGGLGCPVAQYLVAAGVGQIHLLDNDKVELSNLQRQVVFTEKDLGKPKALIAQQRLAELNTECCIKSTVQNVQHDNVNAFLSPATVVVDCCDDLYTKYLLNDVASQLKKPLISASLLKFRAQLALYQVPDTPCMRCIFPAAQKMQPESCDSAGILGPVAGVLGSLQALEVLKYLAGGDNTAKGKLMVLDLLNYSMQFYAMQKDPECPLCGDQPRELIYPQLECPGYEMSWHEFKARPDIDKFSLIDVREPHEHRVKNLGGVNIPLAQLPSALEKLDKQQAYLLYCCTGNRSRKAMQLLRDQGFCQVYSLDGNIASQESV